MFEMEVIGFSRGIRTKKDGSTSPYTRVYCNYPLDSDKFSNCEVDGYGCEVLFVYRLIPELKIGSIVSPVYNKYGSCIDILCK